MYFESETYVGYAKFVYTAINFEKFSQFMCNTGFFLTFYPEIDIY